MNLQSKKYRVIKTFSLVLLILLVMNPGMFVKHLTECFSVLQTASEGYNTFLIPDAPDIARLLLDKPQFNDKEIVCKATPDVSQHSVTVRYSDEQFVVYTFFFSLPSISRAPPVA